MRYRIVQGYSINDPINQQSLIFGLAKGGVQGEGREGGRENENQENK